MKTFILDIVSKISSYSKKLDDKSLIINKKWILVDDSNEKSVFIFRENNQLLISENGIIQKSSWEYITKDLVSLEINNINYLFTPAFLDENMFILKLDSRNEYVVFINENQVREIINSLNQINDFIDTNYLNNKKETISYKKPKPEKIITITPEYYPSDKGELKIELTQMLYPSIGNKVYFGNSHAPDGKYKLGFMWYIYVKDGTIIDVSVF